MEKLQYDWTQIKGDMYGNPRYVIHFLNLLTDEEKDNIETDRYKIAIKRANTIGGRKYHTQSYGGGIVFQSYNLELLERKISKILENQSIKQK